MENRIKDIENLLTSNIGDKGRLEFILSSLQQGKQLYNSDKIYLEQLLSKTLTDEIAQSESKSVAPVNSHIDNSPVKHNDKSTSDKPSKPTKTPRIDNTSYGITYHVSGRNEVKIHHNSCRFYRNASQSGSTKWVFRNGYQNAKSNAASIAHQQSTYYKNAQCCLNGIISRSLSASLFISLFPFLGLLGNLIIRDYYPSLGKGLKYFGLFYGVIAIIFYVANNVYYFVISLIGLL